ncbi:phosphoribosyltransferase [Pseudomonas alkylphenolica]|uniref:phosphoribosyltransferase n=1 Tax=Pseudomonas alkylphenolica TaxID=237609 RepID=UPI00315DE127
MSNVVNQHTKKYPNINYNDVMHLYDYHPWGDGTNPNIDNITHTILNIKNQSNEARAQARRRAAVNYFTKVLTTPPGGLSKLVDGDPCFFAVVPSHTKGNVSEGLMSLMRNLIKDFNFVNANNILLRYNSVQKAAAGGVRCVKVHSDSIRVTEEINGKTVFLFDDVASTGCSLLACKELLLKAGASRVAMIALGRTYMEY